MESFSQFLFEKFKLFSNLTAIKINQSEITYSELHEKALRLASAINTLKDNRNETVGIIGQRNFSAYLGILATLYSGCSYTPINSKQSDEFIFTVIKESGIKLLICDYKDLEFISILLKKNALFEQIRIIIPETNIDHESNYIDKSFLEKYPSINKPEDIKMQDTVYVLYTSGTTGRPKGVQITQSNLLAWINNMQSIYNFDQPYNASQTYDLTFDPSVADMFFTWANGGTLCVLPEEEKLMPSEYINRENITLWSSVPTIISFMNDMGALKPNVFPNIERSLFCGEALTQKLANTWQNAAPNSTIENLYGPTEATIFISRFIYRQEYKDKQFTNAIVPIGKPFNDHIFELVDDQGKKIENGGKGEIVYKGPQISKGYLNDPEKTSSLFVRFKWDQSPDIWYRSGDIGVKNENGDFEFLGRLDNQIKFGGRRVELGEIESNILKSDTIDNIVVVPIRNNENIIKTLVGFTTSTLNDEEKVLIRNTFSNYMDMVFYPKRILTVKAYPQNTSGKIDRKQLIQIAIEEAKR